MKKLAILLAALVLASGACIAGCSSSEGDNAGGGEAESSAQMSSEELENAYLASTDAFASQLSHSMLESASDNICISPISLYYAISMLASGLAGDAQDQILEAVQVEDASQLEDMCRFGLDGLIAESDAYKLAIADSIWISDDYKFSDQFKKVAEEDFAAEAFNADFGTKQADNDMSKWIHDKTNGLLAPNFQTNREQVAALINTIYFKDAWVEQFSPSSTEIQAFHAPSGDIAAPFMKNTIEGCGFADKGSYSMAEMYFTSGATMTFYLPESALNPATLLSSPEAAAELLSVAPDSFPNINYSIPKFSFSTNAGDLIPVLMDMGINDAFSNPTGTAFDDMFEYTGDGTPGVAYVSDVRQETNISISEEGVEAAAYTEVGIEAMSAPDPSPPIEFTLDRPFLFKICAPDSTVLFVGIVMNPSV